MNGDTSCDKKINLSDLFRMKMMIAGFSGITGREKWAADVNGNYTVNIKDCFDLKYYVTTGLRPVN